MTDCLSAQSIKSAAADILARSGNMSGAEAYLSDESHLQGRAERLFHPESEAELAGILRLAREAGTQVTISGGRTGITGGAVPMGGWLVSLEKMNRILGLNFDHGKKQFRLRCQPGVLLETVEESLQKKNFDGCQAWPENDRTALKSLQQASEAYVFPPDTTEKTATIGGMLACNASGARTFHYGATRNYVSALRVVLMDGSVITLRRNECQAAKDGSFRLALPDGQTRAGRIPGYVMPQVKNAAGYFSKPGMDLLDLFIGSEGTLGVFSEIELVVIPTPEMVLGVVAFFSTEKDALKFVHAARGDTEPSSKAGLPSRPLALEFLDRHALNILREQKQKEGGAGSAIPALPSGADAAIYIEAATTNAQMDEVAEAVIGLLESCGSRSDQAWTATTLRETEKLKAFRHALPEAINQRIAESAVKHPGLTKLGTDFAVPDQALDSLLALYHSMLDAAGLAYVIFGHVGNNHLHVNILPRNMEEYSRGKAIYLELAEKVLGFGGTVSGEHGIGKLKKPLLQMMYGEKGLAAMRAVKSVFDPEGLLNQGNMF